MPHFVLLGPQRLEPIVKDAIDSLDVEAPLALVTAGWEERESEDEELRAHVGHPCENLRLYSRIEEVFVDDPEFHQAVIDRHDLLRNLQELYRGRLDHALEAARELFRRDGEAELIIPERADALAALAALDAHHLERVREVHAEFEAHWKPGERESLARQRDEVRTLLDQSGALAIAGGHVVVLLNRLRLFGILDAWAAGGDRPVVAWAAGAMVLTNRLVVFHDTPPQGPGNPEVLETGLGICPGLVALPHARRRLRLGDPVRVAIFARRFAPRVCAALDEHCRIDFDGTGWTAHGPTRQLQTSGQVEALPSERQAVA